MRKTRRLGLAALFALLLVGGLPACSQSDKAGIVLKVTTDATVPNYPPIDSLRVTIGRTTKTYPVSGSVSGTLGIKTSPGTKTILVEGLAGQTVVASRTVTVVAEGGKVTPPVDVILTAVASGGDAGVPDASPSGTGGAPGFDASPGSDLPASTGGSGGAAGATASGGTTGTAGVTSAGGAAGTGGLSSTGGSKPTGGSLDAGGGAAGFDASSGSDGPAAGGSGGTGGATISGGTTRTGGSTSTGGATRTGGQSNTGGSSSTGGTTSTGGGSSTGGSKPTGGTTSTGGATGGAPGLVATAVAVGYDHSCALIKDGTIWCWGNNSDGQLGNQDPKIDGNAIIYETKPVQAKGVTQAISVAAGDYHTCAALASGTVQCWGYNEYGQLGNGASGYNTRSITPTAVLGMPAGVAAVAVVAGSNHTCALLSDKTVKCWGDNSYDQLGSGSSSSTLTSSMVPVTVVTNASTLSPLTNVTALALTTDHACAIQSGGALYCWGDNLWGQLGNGTANSTTVAVRAGTIQAVAVGTGDGHTCVVGSLTTGSPFNVQCWGRDSYGELGDNGSGGEEIHTPVNARVSANASMIALGTDHSCAVLVNPNLTVECWGLNTYGQLGNGNTGSSLVPVGVLSLTQAKLLSAGEGHTCAVVSSGAVYCWGHNELGQLGDGNGGPYTQSAVPVLVSGF